MPRDAPTPDKSSPENTLKRCRPRLPPQRRPLPRRPLPRRLLPRRPCSSLEDASPSLARSPCPRLRRPDKRRAYSSSSVLFLGRKGREVRILLNGPRGGGARVLALLCRGRLVRSPCSKRLCSRTLRRRPRPRCLCQDVSRRPCPRRHFQRVTHPHLPYLHC